MKKILMILSELFRYNNSYNTRFTGYDFSFFNFKKEAMKYCGFNGAKFEWSEFKNANMIGSRFKGAQFRKHIIYNVKLSKANFKDAKFEDMFLLEQVLKM